MECGVDMGSWWSGGVVEDREHCTTPALHYSNTHYPSLLLVPAQERLQYGS